MKAIKSKVITLKYLRLIFAFVFLAGVVGFLFFSLGNQFDVVRNGTISCILMIFGILSFKICNYYICAYTAIYKSRVRKCHQNKVIDFEKIA